MNDENLKKGTGHRFQKGEAAARIAGSKGGNEAKKRFDMRAEAQQLLYDEGGAKAVIKAMYGVAISGQQGCVQAATFLRDTAGEKPKDETEITGAGVSFYFGNAPNGEGDDICG